MSSIFAIFANRILLSVVFAYVIAGALKLFFNYLLHERIDFMTFFRTGGMPSSHTAVVGAMSSAVFFSEGASNLFVVSVIMSMIIMSDAVGIRRAAGKQAEVLNRIIEEVKYFKKFKTIRLYELLGHTPKQAIVGLILGVIVAKIIFMV